MIVDRLQNYKIYPFGKAWQLAFNFLISLNQDAEEKRHPLQGDDIFALVMSYETRLSETTAIETHRKYLDIQAVITGEEGIGWCQSDELKIDKPYDISKDVEFYKHPEKEMQRVNLFPGNFVALFPHDAHMPALMTKNVPEFIKKVVVKVNVKLL